MPHYFTRPDDGTLIEVPEQIISADGKTLIYSNKKDGGWTPGGWYKDDNNNEYLAKFYTTVVTHSYTEKLLTDLSNLCVGDTIINTSIGYGDIKINPENSAVKIPCILVSKLANFIDFETKIKRKEDIKSFTKELHQYYSFLAFVANDDVNLENLGTYTDNSNTNKVTVIDHGLTPTFLYPEQKDYSKIPFQLASLISHRNLNLMPLLRRRYFGHEFLIHPKDRFNPAKTSLEEGISYLDVLDGIRKIISVKDEILSISEKNLKAVRSDPNINEQDKEAYLLRYNDLPQIFAKRIEWMSNEFRADLEKMDDVLAREKFSQTKWQHCPEFLKLIEVENAAFKKAAQEELKKGFNDLTSLLEGRSRSEIMQLDLRNAEVADLRDSVTKNYTIYNAIVAGDFELANWLVDNNLVEESQGYLRHNHNWQLFRNTPLHAAITTHHDKLFYRNNEDLKPLEEIIHKLEAQFIAKNGDSFDKSKGDAAQGGNTTFMIDFTFRALENYKNSREQIAATDIQRAFRAHNSKKLSQQSEQESDKSQSVR
ncbi:MAG: hypothetical protein SFV53_00090 [Rickettsiales bacterium]|nr:hypothetical protein [Rickettsiales bacterium]